MDFKDIDLNGYDNPIDFPGLQYQPPKKLFNRTHELISRLLPAKDQILNVKSEGESNLWIQIQTILYGGQGSGKTELVKWLLEQAVKKYGLENIEAYYAQADLKSLVELDFKKPVIVLFDDDATLEKLTNQTVKLFTRIRHLAKEKTGLTSGLVLTFVGLHRLHASDPLLRANFDCLICKSAPTGKWDKDFLANYIGYEGVEFLAQIWKERRKDRSKYRYGVFWFPDMIGILENDLAENDYFEKVTFEKPEVKVSEAPIRLEEKRFGLELIESYKDKEYCEEVLREILRIVKNEPLINAFRDYYVVKGYSMRDLSIQYGIPQSTLSDQFKQIREKYLGLAGEAAFEKKLLREGYKNYEMLGGYSHQPDVILHQDRKVISLKHYCNPKAHVPIEEIASSEIQYALEHSYDLEVWLYNLVDQTWKIYKVTLPTQQPSRSTQPQPPNPPTTNRP